MLFCFACFAIKYTTLIAKSIFINLTTNRVKNNGIPNIITGFETSPGSIIFKKGATKSTFSPLINELNAENNNADKKICTKLNSFKFLILNILYFVIFFF